MIGCPVSSIRRHNSLETVIEDYSAWVCESARATYLLGNITLHGYPVTGEQK